MSDAAVEEARAKVEPYNAEQQSKFKTGPKSSQPKLRGSKTSSRKTINAPGSIGMRTAQACDRCRAKKSRCDGKQPACSSCAAAGMECVVSDRLTRKSYPKGYTELLEEQSRQLIAENARLKGALSMRDEQLAVYAAQAQNGAVAANTDLIQKTSSQSENSPVLPSHVLHTHEEGCSCCSDSLAVHERPVSVAGSVYNGVDDLSIQGSVYSDFDDDEYDLVSTASGESLQEDYYVQTFGNAQIRPAPGAFAAATAIEQMQNKRGAGQKVKGESKEQMLTALVAASVPRSTEETLFIPTLLARVCEAYGYASTSAKLTASALASLKDANPSKKSDSFDFPPIFSDSPRLEPTIAAHFLQRTMLPPQSELDSLLKVYFQDWGCVLPIINKNAFLKNYPRLAELLQHGVSSLPAKYCYESAEKLGALVVLAVALALLSQKHTGSNTSEYASALAHYDSLIHEFIKPNCILTKTCSLQSLQILALALQYCLATGDFMTCYELRGRVVTMAQQLRLHRCPAAVLGLSREMNDRTIKAFMQGERRIVFWCVYVLDVYASLNLGVPRLLKDYEIECATPFSGKTDDDTENNENILIVNNTKLTIFGKVTRVALCVMQYCKVLGNIMDTIFSRSGNYNVHEKALEKDQMLDCWRRDLPEDLRFETDVNGYSFGESGAGLNSVKHPHLLVFLYYHAKILIYLPIISKYGYHHNVGLSMKEKLALGQSDISTNVSSMTSIQQSAVQILHLLKYLSGTAQYLLPVPINIPREHARFAILVAKGALDYIKGGPLHLQSKQLLLETIPLLKGEALLEIPSSLTQRSASLLEYAILSILGLNLGKVSGGNLRRRIINNDSLAKFGQTAEYVKHGSAEIPNPAFANTTSFDLPMADVTPSSGPMQYSRVPAQNLQNPGPFQSTGQNMDSSIDGFAGPGNAYISAANEPVSTNRDSFDENGDIFKFDELIKNFGSEYMNSEFVTDGSLGLVPFLNEPNDYFN
ncbi:hypothetical protein OY671_006437 [Metschnikowia pulcherrima]|nr:hypothetical protein OY671_006437 [Metschnikowia pulcherrima]